MTRGRRPGRGYPAGTAFEDIPEPGSARCAERVSGTSPSTRINELTDWGGLRKLDVGTSGIRIGAARLARLVSGRLGAGGAPAPRGRARTDRRDVLVVVCRHGYRHPAARHGSARAARTDGSRDVRWAHSRAGGALGRAPGRPDSQRAWSTCSSPTRARSRWRWRSKMRPAGSACARHDPSARDC